MRLRDVYSAQLEPLELHLQSPRLHLQRPAGGAWPFGGQEHAQRSSRDLSTTAIEPIILGCDPNLINRVSRSQPNLSRTARPLRLKSIDNLMTKATSDMVHGY
ncbi:hypothetical protein A4X13_0g1728 [Tilletia indica]|uniref:Uncharacterized protein n=1 Tax=Tilletia indica TaxID=43049 RepID=A0A8T8TAA0_9BASI|nr:hypothetical protein A4X13_0g1728 [Tilletia indica]